MTRRYAIEIRVIEINAEGYERDEYAKCTTALAIENLQSADDVAIDLYREADKEFVQRTDSSPVTPKDAP